MKKIAVLVILMILAVGCISEEEETPETSPSPLTTTPTVTTPSPTTPASTTQPPTTPTPITPPTTTPAPASSPVEGYIILTNISPDDPFYKGVLKLRDYREASIVSFNGDVRETLEELRSRDVIFVAIMVRPEMIDEDFAYDVFQLSKEVDTGYETDFAYGFITGITPEDVLQYVENVILYESGHVKLNPEFRTIWRTGERAVGGGVGGWGDQMTQDVINLFRQLGFDASRIDTDQLSTKQELLSEISRTGVLHFLLHGSPGTLLCAGSVITHLDIPELQEALFIFNSGCYGGCIYKAYNQGMSAPDTYAERAWYTEPSKTLPLNFLENGTLAYFGHMCMWGDNKWSLHLMEALVANNEITIGEMIKEWYDVPSGPSIIKGASNPDTEGMDRNRFTYAAVILYGDPALHILM
ncbi:MAG: hypothetical protein KAT49_06345 [Methanomicrobia archaeon]|nr:hypothetical protein [Methanomicrobia archaeon]